MASITLARPTMITIVTTSMTTSWRLNAADDGHRGPLAAHVPVAGLVWLQRS